MPSPEQEWIAIQQELWGTAPRSLVVRANGALDVTALERAVGELVQRHATLRTTFLQCEEGLAAHELPAPALDGPGSDVEPVAADALDAWVERHAFQPFDLAAGPLLRMRVARLSERDHAIGLFAHPIVADAPTLAALLPELGTIYEAMRVGSPPPPPSAQAQASDARPARLEADLARWSQRIAAAPTDLRLPAERARPPTPSQRTRSVHFEVDAAEAAAIERVGGGDALGRQATWLAAFGALLHRYSGETGIPIGLEPGQHAPGDAIGPPAPVEPLWSDVAGDPSFRSHADAMRSLLSSAGSGPASLLDVLALGPGRIDPSRHPLFQTSVRFDAATPTLELPDLTWRVLRTSSGASPLDLTLSIAPSETGFAGSLHYATDLFDASSAERMVGQLRALLEGAIRQPETRISALPVMPESERQRLLREWNAPDRTFPVEDTLHERFSAQARRTPDAIAVQDGDRRLTYRELEERSNRLAHHLVALGAQREVVIGLCLKRSVEIVVSILGILKSGAAYVPLDPDYPSERIGYMLEDSRAPLIVTEAAAQKALPPSSAQLVRIDVDAERIAGRPQTPPDAKSQPDDLAYVIFTSGSTGRPKGVMIPHRNVVRLFLATDAWFHFDESDVWTLFHSYAFDFSVWEIWGALLYGGRLVVAPYSVTRSGAAFHDLLCQEKVTVLNQTPTAFQQVVHADAEKPDRRQDLALRLVIFGGEALEINALAPWFEQHGSVSPQLVNMYGITETTVHVTYRPLSEADLGDGLGSSIGAPIPDLQTYVLDANGRLAPIGAVGELHVGGAGLARGYMNRPEISAERFIESPLGDETGARLYRSGDLARYRANGELEYLGRIDHQVNLRGFRIELGEIETALATHPKVRDSLVLLSESGADPRLVAFVVREPDTEPAFAELRRYLWDRLPAYMAPARMQFLDAFPLTPNGKIDRRALLALDARRQQGGRAGEAPDGDVATVADVFADVLGRPVRADDDFFALGGDPRRAWAAVSRLRALWEKPIPLRTLFEAPSPAAFWESLPHELRRRAGQRAGAEVSDAR